MPTRARIAPSGATGDACADHCEAGTEGARVRYPFPSMHSATCWCWALVMLSGCPNTVVPAPIAPDVTATDATSSHDAVSDSGRASARFWCERVADNMPVGVSVPEGFCVRRFARVPMARVLAFAPNGDVFVASPGMVSAGGTGPGLGAIVVLPDDDRDGIADDVLRFADGLPTIHGLAFDGDSLLYTLHEGVRRAPYSAGDRRAVTPIDAHALVADLRGSERWTHTLARADNGAIYVSVGVYGAQTCPQPESRGGRVLRLDANAPSGLSPVMIGLRNPMYLRCLAGGDCYAMELIDDAWDGAGERLLAIRPGDDHGYPCCQDRGLPAPSHASASCASVPDALMRITHHHVPFGFDRAPPSWPLPFRGAWFVAQHGEVGSWRETGIVWSPPNAPSTQPRTLDRFVVGWGRRAPVEGRTADARFAPDGRMFFADDADGAVYWIAPRSLAIN
jgi:glucose/arabinose dehydrogenase